MSEPLRILLVEDRAADAHLIQRALGRISAAISTKRVDHKESFVRALEEFLPDLVLSDLSLPGFSGLEALRLLRNFSSSVPLIFVSGTIGEEKAVDLLKLGAADYVIKDNLARLVPAVERTINAVRLERERQLSQQRYQEIYEQALVGICQIFPNGVYRAVNPAFAAFHGYDSPEEMMGMITNVREQIYVSPEAFDEAIATLQREGVAKDYHLEHRSKDGATFWLSHDGRAVRGEQQEVLYYESFAQNITQRKEAEQNLEATRRRLIDASRQAGMAEVATNVLHNVGNVMNSVNVSTSLLGEKLNKLPLPDLARVARLLRDHEGNLEAFFRDDPRAKKLGPFVEALWQTLEEDRHACLEEIQSLRHSIDHINNIVSTQQNYTKVAGMVETVGLQDLVEDALRLNAAALVRHGVTIRREFAKVPPILVERHKVLQILVNLISNAKYAMDETGGEKRLILRIAAPAPGYVIVSVVDNGLGIPSDNLARIFEHGFSTRTGGHGFGLHGSALTAHELGGTLTAASDGLGHGATFTLVLPLQPPASAESRSTAEGYPATTGAASIFARTKPPTESA